MADSPTEDEDGDSDDTEEDKEDKISGKENNCIIEKRGKELVECCRSWCPDWEIFTFQFSLTVGDMGTDLNNAWTHAQNCNYGYCALTLLFVVLQSLPTLTNHIRDKIQEFKSGEFVLPLSQTKYQSVICGVSYLVLVCIFYCSGGFVLVTMFQVGQTIIFLLRLCWVPPTKNGELNHDFQRKAFLGKYVESQLESAPQSCLQMFILLSHGADNWIQIISVSISLISVSKGTVDSMIMMKSCNRRVPYLGETALGMLAILPDTLLRFFTYSIAIICCIHGSLALRYVIIGFLTILVSLLVLIAALTTDSFESFTFSAFSSLSSPLLFEKKIQSVEACESYEKNAVLFYAKNKLVTSLVSLMLLTVVFYSMPQQEQRQDQCALPFYEFDCPNKCSLPTSANVTCLSQCEEEQTNILNIFFGFSFVKIWKNTKTCEEICNCLSQPQVFYDQKKISCEVDHHVVFFFAVFPLLVIYCLLSICDSLLVFSPYSHLSPSAKLLFPKFKIKDLTKTETSKTVDITSKAEKFEEKKKKSDKIFVAYLIASFVSVRTMLLYEIIKRFSYCQTLQVVFYVACATMPTLPEAVGKLQTAIFSLRSEVSLVRFLRLAFFCLMFLGGGFLLNVLYQWGLLIVLLYQMIARDVSSTHEICVYKLLFLFCVLDQRDIVEIYINFKTFDYISLVSFFLNTLLYDCLVMSAGYYVMRNHKMPGYKAVITGALAFLPERALRIVGIPSLALFGSYSAYGVFSIQSLANFFTAALLCDDVQAVFASIISAPILLQIDAKDEKKKEYNYIPEKFYATSKILTSLTFLCYLSISTMCYFYQEDLGSSITQNPSELKFQPELDYSQHCLNICPGGNQSLENDTNLLRNVSELDGPLKSDICNGKSISSWSFHMILVPILFTLSIFSLIDGCLVYRNHSWAPSNMLLFSKKAKAELDERNTVEENELKEEEAAAMKFERSKYRKCLKLCMEIFLSALTFLNSFLTVGIILSLVYFLLS